MNYEIERIKQLLDQGYSLADIGKFEEMRAKLANLEKETEVESEDTNNEVESENDEPIQVIKPEQVSYTEKADEFMKIYNDLNAKLNVLDDRMKSVSAKFGEMTDSQVYRRTTDDILSEILMPNGDRLNKEEN